ncbi:MAG: hypothetical protein CL623_00610 [Arcobacter sp.]|nr:hypothetical protein [Arcobacter sp.]|tara:strand:+ start:1263 stop:1490 length:228 start_codon:yes stop_codon:yes gene_type:complete
MNKQKQTIKSKISKIIIYITLIISVVFIYISSTKNNKSKGFSSALYTGETKVDNAKVPSKLKWFDSFKGIDNMAK